MSSFKESPSHDSMSISSGARISLLTDDSSLLARDFSLTSITSSSSASASSSQDEFFKSSDHAESTLRRMQNYLDNKQLCDVILIAGLDGRK